MEELKLEPGDLVAHRASGQLAVVIALVGGKMVKVSFGIQSDQASEVASYCLQKVCGPSENFYKDDFPQGHVVPEREGA